MANKERNTKRLICESFKELLLHHPFEKITIKMITDGAGVIRPTFYHYFQDKHEVFEWILKEELFDVIITLIDNDMEEETFKIIIKYFRNNREFYCKAFKVTGQNSFEEILAHEIFAVFRHMLEKHHVKLEYNSLLSPENLFNYYCMGIVYILKTWIMNDKEEWSEQEVYNAVLFLITHSLLDIMENENASGI